MLFLQKITIVYKKKEYLKTLKSTQISLTGNLYWVPVNNPDRLMKRLTDQELPLKRIVSRRPTSKNE